jgi:predicted RNase H-like nuclease (RuvC/YqgF family)
MVEIEEELKEKKRKLQELVHSRSKATCAGVYSSGIDVRRETEIEELEEDIRRLEKKLKSG